MTRVVIEVPVISEALRRIGAPVSALVRSGALIATCGMPPISIETGLVVEGDIETQTRASLEALEYALRLPGAPWQMLSRPRCISPMRRCSRERMQCMPATSDLPSQHELHSSFRLGRLRSRLKSSALLCHLVTCRNTC